MIIGISGKIGSGKDTVAKIIQYLVDYERKGFEHPINEIDLNSYVKNGWVSRSEWKVVKFADKLKDIVCLLLGCTREQLERPEFKNSILPDEWQVYELYNFNQKIYRGGLVLFTTEKEVRDFCDENTNSQHQYTYKKSQRTVRWLLQYIGTDLFREKIHPNVHINATFAAYNPGAETTERRGPHDNWLITDVRFPNEADAIIDKGGFVIRMSASRIYVEGGSILRFAPEGGDHESETALDTYKRFKYGIHNESTIEALIVSVRQILLSEGIIQ